MSNFIKRDIADKAGQPGTKLERLLGRFEQDRNREGAGGEHREEAQEQKPSPRALPRGFQFRRRIN